MNHKLATPAQKPFTIHVGEEGNYTAVANQHHRAAATILPGDPDACRDFTALVYGEGSVTMYSTGMQDGSVDVVLVMTMVDNPVKTWQRRFYGEHHYKQGQPRLSDVFADVEQAVTEWLNL